MMSHSTGQQCLPSAWGSIQEHSLEGDRYITLREKKSQPLSFIEYTLSEGLVLDPLLEGRDLKMEINVLLDCIQTSLVLWKSLLLLLFFSGRATPALDLV